MEDTLGGFSSKANTPEYENIPCVVSILKVGFAIYISNQLFYSM